MKGKDWPQQGKPWRTLPGADISPTKLASKASRNLALEYRLRKPRTAARFGPKPCETATTKTLETSSLTKPIRRLQKRKKNERKRLAPARKTFAHASRGRHIAYTKLASKASRNLALEYRLRKPQTAARFGPKPCETATTKTLETSLTKPIKKKEKWKEKIGPSKENLGARFQEPTYRLQSLPQKRLEIWPWSTACESLEQQQDSGPSHAKPPPQKLSKRRLRNPLKRKMKRKDWLQQGTPLRKPLRTLPGAYTKPTYRPQSLPQKRLDLGVLPAKASNSSKIRAQAMRNRHHKNSRNVAYETYEKERKMNERKRLAPARKTLAHASRSRHIAYKACLKSVSKSGLGVPPAKASNSSKIRAQKEKWKEKIGSSKENLCARF